MSELWINNCFRTAKISFTSILYTEFTHDLYHIHFTAVYCTHIQSDRNSSQTDRDVLACMQIREHEPHILLMQTRLMAQPIQGTPSTESIFPEIS